MTYYVSVRSGERGWVLIDVDIVPETVINATFAALGAGAHVVLMDSTFPLAVAGISFSADSQVLEGQGRGTFIDGDALATGVHAINLSGFIDCIIKNLSVQTEDGGGKNCVCVFIQDGADRFRVENVTVVNSDKSGITVEGTNIEGGWITACEILDADEEGIRLHMDNLGGLTDVNVQLCRISSGTIGIHAYKVVESIFGSNIIYSVTGHGIYVDYADGCIVVANHLRDITNDGIKIFDSDDVTVEANKVRNADDAGLEVDGSSTRANIKGNVIYGCGEHGIELASGVTFYHIVGNVIYANGTTAGNWYGIELGGNSECNIEGNTIIDNDLDGIFLEGDSDSNFMSGNFITDNGRYGINISVATCNLNRIGDNYLLGNTTGCINDLGTATKTPERFYAATGGNDPDVVGNHPGYLVDSLADSALTEVYVPRVFQQLLEIVIVIIAKATLTPMSMTAGVNYGAEGEAYNVHTNVGAPSLNVTNNVIHEIDISGLVAALAADDYLGVILTHMGENVNCLVLGVRLRYV